MSNKENRTLSVQGILGDLDNGLTRKDIQDKYELSGRDMKHIFNHPDLKGKKTKPPVVQLVGLDGEVWNGGETGDVAEEVSADAPQVGSDELIGEVQDESQTAMDFDVEDAEEIAFINESNEVILPEEKAVEATDVDYFNQEPIQ